MNFPKNFICAGQEYTTLEKFVPAPYFRKIFTIEKKVETAKLLITGIGYYELYLNGRNITKGLLAPYRSNPDQITYYDEYSVADMLNIGENVIGILLGNGIQNGVGAFIWDFDKASFRGAPRTAFDLDIKYSDGTDNKISSGTDMVTAPSPIIFDDLHLGEYYDASHEIPGWNLPDFDDSNWKPACTAPIPAGEMRICEAEPIVIHNEIKPVSITKQDDSFLYDFGINTAGVCRLKINGTAGQKIILQHGETLKDGKLWLQNNRFNPQDRYQEDEYYCKGGETEEFTPHFTYHGFRYVLVTGITAEQATEDLLTYLEIYSDIKLNGEFYCDDEVINKIQEATVRSDVSNFHYFPTDCPQREKNGWTADASLSSEQTLINLTPENSYKEWMHSIYKSLTDAGSLPGIVPTTGWGFKWGNGPAWDNVIINLPYYTYVYRGDRQIIEEAATPIMRYLNYLYSRLDENDLLAIGLGDWCPPGKQEGDYTAPLIVTDSIVVYDIAKKASFIYSELDMQPQKQFADTMANRIRTAFRKNLIDFETMIVNGNCQTSQAMAIFYGLFEESEIPEAFSQLLRFIDEADGHFDTGVLGGRVIYRTLADYGQAELAYNMVVRPDYPSYGNWIKRGATTLWEAFQPEGGRILSLNHHFWGDISAWFYKYLAGININPDGRDTSRVDIKPIFISKLSFVKASINIPLGKVSAEWKRIEDGIELKISVPDGVNGKIVLSGGYLFENGNDKTMLESRIYHLKKMI